VRALSAGLFAAVAMLMIAGIAEASLSRLWVSLSLMVLAALAVAADNIHQQK
jgi:hypothetical protein